MTTRPTLSMEFFPPKDGDGEARLWATIDAMQPLAPDFLAVTYGAGGSTRDRTIRITSQITERTGIPTVAHLTCVGSTKSELEFVLARYRESGIERILALRGDPSSGPQSEWASTVDGFDHADQLVELAVSHGFTVGVAAFPDGHPASKGDFVQDVDVLLRKEKLGARSATTQFFFDVSAWERLVERLAKKGSSLPIIAGILPISNLKQLSRMAELNGTPVPEKVIARFAGKEGDADAVREIGIEIATELSQELINAGVPGLHYFTMNTAPSTLRVVQNLGLR